MSEVIKHTLKFGEQRRTVLLAANGKDLFGRHRGQVMYGCKLSPSGTSVNIGPGALYTAFGTRLYLDMQGSSLLTLNLDDPTVVNINNESIFSAHHYARRPLVVAIIAKFDVYDPSNPADLPQSKQVEDENEVAAQVSFQAKLVSWDRATLNPAFNIFAQNPIFMNQGEQSDARTSDYDTRNNYSDPSIHASPYGAQAGAIKLDEVVLGYIVIGAQLGNTTPASTLEYPPRSGSWNPGVACIQCKNSWESLEDFIGADVLFGRNDRTVLSSANGITALAQNAGTWNIGPSGLGAFTNTATLALTPKFGTTGISSSVFQVAQANYRLPSFMRDGDSILNVMRRLDYMMRLWMDRTGDQGLIGQIQDGTGTGQTFMSPLLNILNYFDGGASSGSNLNASSFRDTVSSLGSLQTPGTDPNDRVLKTGLIPHADLQATDINSILTTTYGDTHYAALRALDIAIGNILHNVFGLDIPRSKLRTTTDWTIDGVFTDYPINLTTYPTSGISAGIPYIGPTIKKLIPAVNQLLYRSERPVGCNLLKNAGFWAGSISAPSFWITTGAMTLNRPVFGGALSYLTVSGWAAGAKLSQTLALATSTYPVNTAGLISASLMVQNDAVLTMYLVANSPSRQILQQISIPISSTPRTVSMTVDLTAIDISALSAFAFEIVNTSGLASSACLLYGAAVNAGMPNPCPASSQPSDFLSRDGGPNAVMRGNILLGGYDAYFGSLTTDVVWPVQTATVYADPTYGPGSAQSQYLTTESAKAALTVLDTRTNAGVGPNWVHNPNGTEAPTNGGNQDAMPPYWQTAGTLNWFVVVNSTSDTTFPRQSCQYTRFTGYSGNNYIQNYVQLPEYGKMLANDLLTMGGLLSASCAITNYSLTSRIQLQVSHYDHNVGENADTSRFVLFSNIIPPQTSGVMSVTAKINLPPNFAYGYLVLRIVNLDGGNIDVGVIGLAANAGMTQQTPGWDSVHSDYLPRVAGPNFPMTGQINMGSNKIINMAYGTSQFDAVCFGQLAPSAITTPLPRHLSAIKVTPEADTGHLYANFDFGHCADADLHLTTPSIAAGAAANSLWKLSARFFAVVVHGAFFRWKWSSPAPNSVTPNGYTFDEFDYWNYGLFSYPTRRQFTRQKFDFNPTAAFDRELPGPNLPAYHLQANVGTTGWEVLSEYILAIPADTQIGLVWACVNTPGGSLNTGLLELTWLKDI